MNKYEMLQKDKLIIFIKQNNCSDPIMVGCFGGGQCPFMAGYPSACVVRTKRRAGLRDPATKMFYELGYSKADLIKALI